MKRMLLLVIVALSVAGLGQTQPHFFAPVSHGTQTFRGSAVANAGAIGLTCKKQDGKLMVVSVVPGGPAEKGGLKPGDSIISVDGKSAANWSDDEFADAVRKNPGDSLKLTYSRGETPSEATLTLGKITEVYPDAIKEMTFAPGLTQWISEKTGVSAYLAQNSGYPTAVTLWLEVFNKPDAPISNLDAAKFFILDGQGQQLNQFTGAQQKYVVQQWLAQNWRGGTYAAPPPPPAQRTYTIRGTENGTYTIQNMGGGMSTVTGTSNGNYTVTQQPDYTQLGASLGLALRQWKDRKQDKKLLEEANKQIAAIDESTFKENGPLLPGEVRKGAIVYWSGSSRTVSPPFKLIMFLTDPGTNAEKLVTFEFK